MKTFEVRWIANGQSQNSITVDAFNAISAKDQVQSMYGNLPGFNVRYVDDITGCKKEVYSEMYRPSEYSSSGFNSWGEFIGTCIGFVAVVPLIYGLFTMPSGIIFILIGAFLAWVAIQVAAKIDGY